MNARWVLLLAVASVAFGGEPPLPPSCRLTWYDQRVDHFAYGNTTTFKQRVFVCRESDWTPNSPIFFYCGNEADVTIYVNHTGLMWENAGRFKALLVFAEHRYYGRSVPAGVGMEYLTHEQALADYAALLAHFKAERSSLRSPVVAFGGSYGGMLAAWMRMKYPGAVVGAIAGSAPILAFPRSNEGNSFASLSSLYGKGYWEVVTHDASTAAGAPAGCTDRVREGFDAVLKATPQELAKALRLCTVPQGDEVVRVAEFLLFAWDTMAMGNYPYPSNYLTSGGPLLPPWPVREACRVLLGTNDLLEAMGKAAGVYNNATKDLSCYTLPQDEEQDGIWDFMWCTQLLPQETYFARTGTTDMFYKYDFDFKWVAQRCEKKYGKTPLPYWISAEYGEGALRAASNIFFSNGGFDPWSAGGVLHNVSETVVSYIIPDGAHHLDLMFSNPGDTPSVKFVREVELEHIARWIAEAL
eukprot:Sspe_Gene.51688::Locus_28676_Transcript_1_1_Confidence_1.000_Length_1507::g.51688::m.51688/K01285/PRCP; lysosomal Pro-X carboxypeptidase